MRHIHWLLPFAPNQDVSQVHLASARLRAGLFKNTPNYNVTYGYNVGQCDILIVGKIGVNVTDLTDLWINIINRHKNVIFDFTDDHINNITPMTRFYRSVVKKDSRIVVSSQRMKENLQGYDNVQVIEDPYELNIQPVRRANNRFLWYGHPTNLKYLYKLIQQLQTHNPITLEVMTSQNAIPLVEAALKKMNINPNITLDLHPWSIHEMYATHASAVLIPGDVSDIRKNGVSSNRLLTAFAMGCAVCATPYESYKEFSDYFCNIDKVNEFINNHEPYLEKTKEAQKLITKYSEEEMLAKWIRLL